MRSSNSLPLLICGIVFQLQIVTGTAESEAKNFTNSTSDCFDDIDWKPFASFPGCRDESVLCEEDQEVMVNCCKCRCTSDDEGNVINNTACYLYDYVPPPIPTVSSPTSAPSILQDKLNVPSSSGESPAPSIATLPVSTPPPTNYYQNWQANGGGRDNDKKLLHQAFFMFFAIFFVFSLLRRGNQLRTHRTHRRYRAARAERLRRAAMQQEAASSSSQFTTNTSARYERILSKFYFQAVLPDQSNVNPESLKSGELPARSPVRADQNKDKETDIESAIVISKDNGDENKTEETMKEKGETMVVAAALDPHDISQEGSSADEYISHISPSNKGPSSSSSSHHHHPSFCEVLSSWASVGSIPPPSVDVCCICLEVYSAGDTICVAKNPNCDHLFHKDCVLEWMKTNDECPLCRINLLH